MVPWTFSLVGCVTADIYDGGTRADDTSKFGTAVGFIVHLAVDLSGSGGSVTVTGGDIPGGITNATFRVYPSL